MGSRLSTILFRNRFLEPDVQGKMMVIYNRRDTLWGSVSKKQGLFSEFFSVLGALKYAEENGAAGVVVFFDSDLYLDPPHGKNWWAYFFEPRMTISADAGSAQEIHFDRILRRFGPHGWNLSWSSVILPRHPRSRPYPLDAGEEMKAAAALVKRHIRVNPTLLEKVTSLRSKYFGDEFVIGVHYRGTDKRLLYPYMSPSYTIFEAEISRVFERHSPGGFRIFIATDEIEFLDWATERYPGKVVHYDLSPRLSAHDPVATKGGTHKNRRFSSLQRGESAVIDCLLLAECSYLIKNRSSLSDVSLAFKPRLPWTMILGPNEPVYSSDPGI